MASPLGNRKNAKFMAVSTAPSINKTPMGSSTPPVPYPVSYDLSNSVGIVPHVKLNSDPAYVLDQTTQSRCTGDEPGTAGGIRSGTVNGEIRPTSASGHVKITGKRVVRVGDTCTLNAGNCPGVYVAGPASAAPGSSANPPIKPETPAEKTFLEKLGLWWEETKTELGQAAAHPVEATKGAVKDTLNIVPQLGQLLMQGSALQSAGEMEQAAALQSAFGNKETASQLHTTAEGVRQSADQIQMPQFEMSNPAQEGGAKIAMAAQLATGAAGLAKGTAKLGARGIAKLGTKAGALEKAAVKEGAALTKEAAAVEKVAGEVAAAGKAGKTGDGFHVKGQAPVVDRLRKILTPGQRTLFDDLIKKINVLDASPKKDSAIFYAGKVGDEPAWKRVNKVVADSSGSRTSINETQLGKYLMDTKTQSDMRKLPSDAVGVIWDEASRKYAQSAEGTIKFVGDPNTIQRGSVFYRVELVDAKSLGGR
jgi:hypothetical protein